MIRSSHRAVGATWLALWIAAAACPAVADQIRTIDAEIAENVVSIEGEGAAAVVRTATRAVPLGEVKEIIFPAAEREPAGAKAPPGARVFLTTGDEVAGEVVSGTDSKLVVRSPSLGQVELELDLVRAIAYAVDEFELRRFRKEILALDAKKDLAVTRAWGRQEGELQQIDEKGVTIKLDALDTVTLGPDRIVGGRFRQWKKPPAPPAGTRARLDLADGGVVLGKLLSLRGGAIAIETGFRAAPPLELRAAEARSLSFQGGRVVYVSDLDPVEVEERAKVISIVFKHREDANVMGNPLRLAGKPYRKGLGVHAYARLAYKLDGGFARFRAVVGLDDEARERRDVLGTVRFQVLVDGKPALGEAGVGLTTRDAPRPVDVDVTGVATLTLIADFGESQDTLARGIWADAHLIKK